jgi:multicomponent Na+:H+ antiporter subunit G
MDPLRIISMLVVAAGAFFLLVGSVGIIRLPDFYARTHATSKSDTLGLMLVLAGLAIYEGFDLNSVKLLLVLVFVVLTNPVGAHALARAALEFGLRPTFAGEPRDAGAAELVDAVAANQEEEEEEEEGS